MLRGRILWKQSVNAKAMSAALIAKNEALAVVAANDLNFGPD